MLERIRNLIKADRKKSKEPTEQQHSTPKRTKGTVDHILRRYPVTVCHSEPSDDVETMKQHSKAICNEMKKAKPRDRVLLPLMKSTFSARWLFITKDAGSVKQILEEYPSLKIPAIVSHTKYNISEVKKCISM